MTWHMYNAHPRKTLNCKLVKRSRELLNWSRCVSWFIAPADQILQWTWKKKLSRIGSSFRTLRKPDPPFTNSYGSSICWRKQPDVPPANSWWRSLQMQRNLWEAGDSVRLTSCECQAAWLPVQGACSRSYWARNRGKHSAISAKDPSHGGRKRRKKLELRLGLNCLLNQRRSISINQSFSYAPCFQGASLSISSKLYCKNWTYLPAILVKLLSGVNERANIFRMEKQNITISDECSGFRAQFYSPRSEFIYDIIEVSHVLK